MKTLGVIGIALVAGCSGSPAPPSGWLMADDARIATTDRGQPWCASGVSPNVLVVGRAPGADGATNPAPASFEPSWEERLLAGTPSSLASGFDVEVVGDCDGRRFLIGAAHVVQPSASMELVGFGGVELLRLHFELWVASGGGDSSGGGGGGYYYDDSGEPGSPDDGYYVDETGSGDPTNGDPTNGDPTNGDPTNGDPTNGDPTNGDPMNGDPMNGDPTNGDPTNDGSTCDCITCDCSTGDAGDPTNPHRRPPAPPRRAKRSLHGGANLTKRG